MYIEWQERYAIGENRIDAQHKYLLKLINRLHSLIGPLTEAGSAWSLLEEFNDYAETHFSTEESIVEAMQIEERHFAEHRREHERYRQKIDRFRAGFEHGDADSVVPQLMTFIDHWWLNHIQGSDVELGRMIARQRVCRV
jgi:hemerythrin